MKVAVVYNAVYDENPPDERDVLIQANAISDALRDLDHEVATFACDLDLGEIEARLRHVRPDVVFNLVESLGSTGALIHLFPALLDAMQVPYTGSRAMAIGLTSHKLMAKSHMVRGGLPTPPWIGPYPIDWPPIQRTGWPGLQAELRTWIFKSVWEHASIGIEDANLVEGLSCADLFNALPKRAPALGGACFAETFIDGREFNLALLAGKDGPQVLSPAEIIFEGFGDKARIVGYRAKWVVDTYEYLHTSRRFDFGPGDRPLLKQLRELALRCWELFGLGGYARVDFRVDADGRPSILEINANPCLSPDAGFAAALEHTGITFTEAVDRIVRHAVRVRQSNEIPHP
jgi:D-alanine-D-alanine ligase